MKKICVTKYICVQLVLDVLVCLFASGESHQNQINNIYHCYLTCKRLPKIRKGADFSNILHLIALIV